MTYVLWIIQVLLALLFLFAGGTKLVIPPDVLASMGSPNQIPLPGWFVRFIGVCEVLGALGLLLPGLLRIKPRLTPLAAAGLVVIMIGATALTVAATGSRPGRSRWWWGCSRPSSHTAIGGWHSSGGPVDAGNYRRRGIL